MQESMNRRYSISRYDSSNVLVAGLNLPPIRDDQVAKILFLGSKPPEQNNGFDGQCDESSDHGIEKLIEKFRMSLEEKSIAPIRRLLVVWLSNLKTCAVASEVVSSILEKNFSDVEDLLSEEEEDILEFNEIFQMLSIPVPQYLKTKFDLIVKNKNISVPQTQDNGGEFKTFFLYTENKILSEICTLLTPNDVYRIYSLLRENSDDHKQLFTSLNIEIEEDSLTKVEGLKDVAFYYLILHMIDQTLLNRLHTHSLEHFLQMISDPGQNQVNESDPSQKLTNEPDPSRFIEAITKLKKYPISSRPPGLCILFCMDKDQNGKRDREGAEVDVKKVRDLFEKSYRYDFLLKVNPTSLDIQTLTTKLRAPRNKFYDSLVIWFMGHGNHGNLHVRDKSIDKRKEFIEPFSNISWLNKKPKLFFIQACDTKVDDSTSIKIKRQSVGLESDMDSARIGLDAGPTWKGYYGEYLDTSSVNNYADTLIAYATKWFEPASREKEGSLYVRTVVDQLREHGHTESIENVLRKVSYNTNTVLLQTADEIRWKQTPYYESSLQKEFVFTVADK